MRQNAQVVVAAVLEGLCNLVSFCFIVRVACYAWYLSTSLLVHNTWLLPNSIQFHTHTCLLTLDVMTLLMLYTHYTHYILSYCTGTDAGEFVEVSGPADLSLTGYFLVLYNGGTGAIDFTVPLTGSIDNEGASGFGAVAFDTADIQNGSPDGVALFKGTTLIEFLSYEGSFTATGTGAAAGTSTDIGVSEDPAPAVGQSLQKTENIIIGRWQGPLSASKGFLNNGKMLPLLFYFVFAVKYLCS